MYGGISGASAPASLKHASSVPKADGGNVGISGASAPASLKHRLMDSKGLRGQRYFRGIRPGLIEARPASRATTSHWRVFPGHPPRPH